MDFIKFSTRASTRLSLTVMSYNQAMHEASAGLLEPFTVAQDCMGFLLSPGDRIRVRRQGAESLRLGDIVVILFDKQQPFVLAVHRLMWKRRTPTGWRLWTKGDVPSILDTPLAGAGLIGKVVSRCRRRRSEDWQDLEGIRGRLGHLLLGLLSWLFYRAYRRLVQDRFLPALYRMVGPARRLRPLRRTLLKLSLLADD
jgi:hypothetical protein